jgi:hypothetical protein
MPPTPQSIPASLEAFPPDPFFGRVVTPPLNIDPFGLLDSASPARPSGPSAPLANPDLVPSRTRVQTTRRLESYQTRTLILGMIRLFQRRSIIGQDELQYLLANLVEAGEIKDDDKVD